MQSEGELRFCISLYEIFVNLDFKKNLEIFVIQSRNTIHKRINGENLEKFICIQCYSIVRNYVESQVRDLEMVHNNLVWDTNKDEGRICLFNSHNFSVEEIAKSYNYYMLREVAITQNKVNSYGCYFE